MRGIYNVKHHYAICLKFRDKFLMSLTKLMPEAKASICSIIKESAFKSLQALRICCCCNNLTYFYNKACITKKHHFLIETISFKIESLPF